MFQIITTDQLEKISRKYKKNKKIHIDITGTKYDLIQTVGNILDWTILDKVTLNHSIKWYDYYISEDELRKMPAFQKINHFPGSSCLGKKNTLAKNLQKMFKLFPQDYKFFPQTWILPHQQADLISHIENKNIQYQTKLFIAKPEASCQGKGIFLFKKLEEIQNIDKMIVQRYIHNPYLIDGLKFDLRLYVLVKSFDPLKIFLYRDGLARFATQQFKKPTTMNLSNEYMHLTNYAINKKNPKFQQNQTNHEKETGHKRSFSNVLKHLQQDNKNIEKLMKDIKDLIFKTLASVQPNMANIYKSCRPTDENLEVCFEIYGFDIIIDQDMKPWLLEVNHTPSFQTDSNLDYIIKKNLILDTFILLNLKKRDKKLYHELRNQLDIQELSQQIQIQCKRSKEEVIEYENQNLNGFLRVYPNYDETDKLYEIFLEASLRIYNNQIIQKSSSSIITTQKVEIKQPKIRIEKKKIEEPKIKRNLTVTNFQNIQNIQNKPRYNLDRSNSIRYNLIQKSCGKTNQIKDDNIQQNLYQVQNIVFPTDVDNISIPKGNQINIKKIQSAANHKSQQLNQNNVYSLYQKYLENMKLKQQMNKIQQENYSTKKQNIGFLKTNILQRKYKIIYIKGFKVKNKLNLKIEQPE